MDTEMKSPCPENEKKDPKMNEQNEEANPPWFKIAKLLTRRILAIVKDDSFIVQRSEFYDDGDHGAYQGQERISEKT